MNQQPGKPPLERTVSNTSTQSYQPTEARSANDLQSRHMAAATARPFPHTLPPIISGHDPGLQLPPIGRPSELSNVPHTLPNPSTGPVSPSSTISSRASYLYASSQVAYGSSTSPSRSYANHNVAAVPQQIGKRQRFAKPNSVVMALINE